MSEVSDRLVLAVGLVLVGVGLVDAVVSGEWDLVAVFALIGLVLITLWIRRRANRIPVTLRKDLAHWLERRSERNGEPVDDVLDRAVARYKHNLYSEVGNEG